MVILYGCAGYSTSVKLLTTFVTKYINFRLLNEFYINLCIRTKLNLKILFLGSSYRIFNEYTINENCICSMKG